MRLSITIIKKTPAHITFSLFVNGANSGNLILRNDEWQHFMEILQPDIIRDNDDSGKDWFARTETKSIPPLIDN